MGAIADAFMAYAQPLLEQTDGSKKDLDKAVAVTQMCYNLALLPEDGRATVLSELRAGLKMNDEEFDEFRRYVLDPMIPRHQEMFPLLHRRIATGAPPAGPSPGAQARTTASGEKYSVTDRYAPSPCNSGEKYKFCCGAKRR